MTLIKNCLFYRQVRRCIASLGLQHIIVSDANLPSLAISPISKDSRRKFDKKYRAQELPDLTYALHVNNFGLGKASDEKIVQHFLSLTQNNSSIFWILFTRDLGFIKDSHINLDILRVVNFDIIILQNYVKYFCDHDVSVSLIGNANWDFLQEYMRLVYLIWRRNFYQYPHAS